MNQIVRPDVVTAATSIRCQQTEREQVGEVLAAWAVMPGALLLLGWQDTAPPAEGAAQLERRRTDRGLFRCLSWPRGGAGQAFVAAVRLPETTEPQPGQLLALHGTDRLPLLARLPAAFVGAGAFAEAASELAGPHGSAVARFLCDMVPHADLGRCPALGEALAAFLSRVCVRDGCVELTGSVPEGCSFLQGWGRPLPDGAAGGGVAVLVGERVSWHAVQAAQFDRPDIIAPATGSVLVLPPEAASGLPGLTRLYLLTSEGVWSRDLVGRHLADAEESAGHLRAMLESLHCPPGTAGCLRASLKPRFEGRDTLHGGARPVRAGVDLAVATGGGCYLTGWLFDPADSIASVHLHGAGLPPAGTRLDAAWTRVARPDVTDAFAGEPSLPRPSGHGHGFAAFAPASTASPAETGRRAPFHLAVAFRDGHAAFLPLTVCDGADPGVPARILASVDLHKPSGLAVVERQLGPAFRGLRGRPMNARVHAAEASRPGARPGARHAVVVPLLDEPALPRVILSGLLADPLASDEVLVFVCGGAWEAARLDELRRRVAFNGVAAVVLHAPGVGDAAQALRVAAAATEAADFLVLSAGVSGAAPGWRSAMRAAALAAGDAACACPTVLYEDWSIRWAGDADLGALETAPYASVRRRLAGMPAAAARHPAAVRAAGLGTLACCLIPRAALASAADGGAWTTPFGQEAAFFSRLAAAGVECVWVPSVQVHAADEASEQAGQPGVERLIDGWCLREDLRDAARAAVPGRSQTREHRKEVICAF